MPIMPGMELSSVTTVDPQRGQKCKVTRPPASPLRLNDELFPSRALTWSSFQRDATAKALPLRRWHHVQQQAVTTTGSPATVTDSLPH
jgi:hypothetical protein